MQDSRREDVMLGLFTVAVVGALIGLSLKVGTSAPQGAVKYEFVMDGVLGLQKDNRVTVAGVTVGVVDDLAVEGRKARMVLSLDPKLQLHADAKAAVRARTLLGEKYVDLDPGAAPAPVLPPGATVEDNVTTVEIDTVIRGAAELVTSLNSMTPSLKHAADRLDGVLETADMRQVTRDLLSLIKDADTFITQLQRNVGDSSQDARALIKDLRTRTPELAARLDATASRLDAVLAAIPEDSLKDSLKKMPGTLDGTQQTLGDIRAAVAELRTTGAKTTHTVESLDKILMKLGDVKEQQIRQVLQVEGLRVNLITDPAIERRVKELGPRAPTPPGK